MNLKGIRLSEISQTEKDKYYMISLVCDLKNKTSEYTPSVGRGCMYWGQMFILLRWLGLGTHGVQEGHIWGFSDL